MDDSEPVARDLFGDSVTPAKARRRSRSLAPAAQEHVESVAEITDAPATVQLRLPTRFTIEGSVLGSPLRQIATKAGHYEGVLEYAGLKRLSAFRFTLQSGTSILIVAKKTAAEVSDEPLLLVPEVKSADAIRDVLERGEGTWLSPRPRRPLTLSDQDAATICDDVLSSWRDQFTPREGALATDNTAERPGLRKPQVGALYAALAHATSSTQPATIVMPTGTGKTETMLAIYAHDRIPQLMVVVPTDALREQIANKMATMGVLQDQQCLTREIRYPVVLQLEHIPKTVPEVDALFSRMPSSTDVDLRNRALIAFAILTGARDGALASLKLNHVDLAQGHVFQDGRTVATKRGKSITTWFFPVGEQPLRTITEWIGHLRGALLWGNDDPLFPKTKVGIGNTGAFEALGLERECWSSASPIREIFRDAFTRAGLPYFNPHSFRNTLAQLGERLCASPEAFKSWSQNLGHEGVLTTLTSYGAVESARQAEIIRSMWQRSLTLIAS